ncbi:MAG: aminotransferase class I/II-fold pyridoxal phosphate-dependent enzyme [bacterium]|nr:aminotransferase class I/II-fold pyridoxal phosphate-dependent enzyme [bacterium]
MSEKRSQATLALHGQEIEKGQTGPVTTPIYQTTTYTFPHSEAVEDYMVKGKRDHYIYGRYGNPGQDILERRFALLENAEESLFFSSGMAAITTAILSCVSEGDEIITVPALYGQTFNFLRNELPSLYGVTTKFIEIEDLYDPEKYLTDKTKLIYFETPANPNLQVVDMEKIVRIAKANNLTTMIDNTFATPINQLPIDIGIDISVHSATKYIGGHSDVLAGVIAGSKEFIDECKKRMHLYGPVIDPFAVFLLTRSLKTLEVRVKRQNEIAAELAEFFKDHPKIEKVLYPGLPDDPGHETAKKQMSGFGGMVNIVVKGGKEGAMRVADNLDIAMNATSLGGVETLVSLPVITSHVWLSDEELKKANISKGMIRISAGLESPQDLKRDFDQALSKI